MITKIKLKCGRSPNAPPTELDATPVTVFVGPNNSGKSRVLRETERYCRTGQQDATDVLIEEIDFRGLSAQQAAEAVERITVSPDPAQSVAVGNVLVGSQRGRFEVPLTDLLRFMQTPTESLTAFCQWFLAHTTLILDGRGRINLVDQQGAGDLQKPAQSSFQVLLRNDSKRHEVRRIVHDAFASYFVIDPTNLGTLRIRLSPRAPANDMEERGIHAEAVDFHSRAQLIDEASDGVKAFTGIITEIMAGDPQIILVDEPEAFLHPSLASKLGFEVSRAALVADKRVLVSTHSPTFVMGCIQSGAPVNIVRLTYRGGLATARVLPSDDILELMRHPLLRSTGVLNGLFYEFVIVTESDTDRVFYQEINERLLEFYPAWGIPNCLFINAQNKQTIQTIIRPLRQLGIPAAGIVDVDILKDGGVAWTKLLTSANIPGISHGPLAAMRAAVRQAMDATGHDMKRDGGVAILPDADREAAENLLSQMAEYGIFAVPGGELESWLRELGIGGHGPAWLISMFERMGEDSRDAAYIKPSHADVWKFIGKVKSWLVDPNRKGIPA